MNETNYIDIEKEKNENYWNLAIGLQQVDNLLPSSYMNKMYKENINGKITLAEIETNLKRYYEEKRKSKIIDNSEFECDFVSLRIVEFLENNEFSINTNFLKKIHYYLFQDVYEFAGQFRLTDIIKHEEILNGDSAPYGNCLQLNDAIDYDLSKELEKDYKKENTAYLIDNIIKLNTSLWQTHPFREGNTRTIAIFIQKYLTFLGYNVNNDLFEKHSKYYRASLVRNTYYNNYMNIDTEDKYIKEFYENLLLGKNNNLKSENLIIKELL